MTNLEFAILGILAQRARTGYAVRMAFERTPLGTYSSSPGSIYPALGRLEQQGLLRRERRDGESARGSQVYTPTPEGSRRLSEWVQAPVTREQVRSDFASVMLRLSVIDVVGRTDRLASFLHDLAETVAAYVVELEEFRAEFAPSADPSALAAFDVGLAGYRGQLAWLRRTRDASQ